VERSAFGFGVFGVAEADEEAALPAAAVPHSGQRSGVARRS
jgi:hypothetical protein